MIFRLLFCGGVLTALFAQETHQRPSPFNYRREELTASKSGVAQGPVVVAARQSPAARAQQPIPAPTESEQTGLASFYGQADDGRKTANGNTFDNGKLTAAHPSLPFGSRVRVTHEGSGRSVVVTVTDRGRFTGGRVISVSRKAAEELGFVSAGTARVHLEPVKDEGGL